MTTDLIVGASMLFAIVFFILWLAKPGLRSWIERPKYRFLANVRTFEEGRRHAKSDPS